MMKNLNRLNKEFLLVFLLFLALLINDEIFHNESIFSFIAYILIVIYSIWFIKKTTEL